MNKSIQTQIDTAYSVGYLSHDDILAMPECDHINIVALAALHEPDSLDLEAVRAANLADTARFLDLSRHTLRGY